MTRKLGTNLPVQQPELIYGSGESEAENSEIDLTALEVRDNSSTVTRQN